jgi:hypothetical protein
MKWKSLIPLSLVGLAVVGAVALVTVSGREDADEFYADYRVREQNRPLARDARLAVLDLALELARGEARRELEQRILDERSTLLFEMGALVRAREDFRAMAELGELTRAQQLVRARIELLTGDLPAARTQALEMCQRFPQDAQMLFFHGEVEHKLAASEEQRALKLLEDALIDESFRKANAALRILCGRDPADPRRVACMQQLRDLLGPRAESITAQVLTAGDKASQASATALERYARSLALEFQPDVFSAYVQLLEGTGEVERALDLCLMAWPLASASSHRPTAEFLLHHLARLERWHLGRVIADAWMTQGTAGSATLFQDVARIAFGSLSYTDTGAYRLFEAGNRLAEIVPIGTTRQPLLYTGLGFHHFGAQRDHELARYQLSRYLSEPEPEPFPRVHAAAYRAWADSCRVLGLLEEQRSALEGAVAVDPYGRGEDWLRLADLENNQMHGGLRLADERLAHAIALLPSKAGELTTRWRQQGEALLALTAFDAAGVRATFAAGQRPSPSVDSSPYELYRLAQLCLESGSSATAQEFLRTLLERVPGFPPALDLQVELATQRKRPEDLVPVLLERLEQVGMDTGLRARFAALPGELLRGEARRRLCLADPEGFGRLAVAESALRTGQRALALEALRNLHAEMLTTPMQVRVAALELEQGDALAAFARLDPLAEQWHALPGAMEVYARAAIGVGDQNALEKQLTAFLQSAPLERERMLRMLREWVALGASRPAGLLSAALDAAGKEFRGQDLLLLRAACEAGNGALDELQASLERLAAVDTRGRAELLQLCALRDSLDLETWRAKAQAARAAGWEPDPLAVAALLKSLGGSPRAEALPEPYAQLFAAEPDPEARLFSELVSPRGLFLCLAALDEPVLAPLALGLLDRAQAAGGELWARWLRGELLLRRGALELARAQFEAVCRAQPQFTPAWDAREKLSGARRTLVRAERVAQQGLASLAPLEQQLHLAHEALARGAGAEAALAAEQALALDPHSPEALESRARALELQGLSQAAREIWFQRLESPAEITGEVLRLALESCREDRAALERLQTLRPADPFVTLALAENDLAQSGQLPSYAVGLAFDRMQRFREAHRGNLEALAPGSTEAWARMLLRLDPARAQALLDAELDADPGNVGAWAMLAAVRAERGEADIALKEIVTLQRMTPSATVLMEYLRIRSYTDWTPEGIQGVARLIQNAPAAPPKARIAAQEAEALLRLGPPGLPRLRELLASMPPAGTDLSPRQRADLAWAKLCSREGPDPQALEALAREWKSARESGLLGVAASILRARAP